MRRAWLLARLSGHLDRHRNRVPALLALEDGELIAALGGTHRAEIETEWAEFDPEAARERALADGAIAICSCDVIYPSGLRELAAPPAVVHVVGETDLLWGDEPAVAIVGARRPSPYGVDVAAALARGLSAAGVTVISGLANGIDQAAHSGALEAGARTLAVLGTAPEQPYPRRARLLHERIRERGAVISELPPGTPVRRWMFPARNRLIAALATVTIVIEARRGSGALLTAERARELGRVVAALPGRVTSPLARGPHELLRRGAALIEGPEDVLELLFGPDQEPARQSALTRPGLEPLERRERALLQALAEGHQTATALARAGLKADDGLAALASLELAGLIRREQGGGYAVRAWPLSKLARDDRRRPTTHAARALDRRL